MTGDDLGGAGIGRILAATDFSDGGSAAVERAASSARQHDARSTLVHAVPEGVGDDMRRFAAEALERIGAELGPSRPDTEVVSGLVGTAITEAGERLDANLIVVGAHEEYRLKDLFIGSSNLLEVEGVIRGLRGEGHMVAEIGGDRLRYTLRFLVRYLTGTVPEIRRDFDTVIDRARERIMHRLMG